MRRRSSGSRPHPDVYRSIASKALGRPLPPGAVVHHINGDPYDNELDNLVVFSSQSAHMMAHHYLRREAAGIRHLYSLEQLLSFAGEQIIWINKAGRQAVLGQTQISTRACC